MDKIWYINILGKTEGPFSGDDLSLDKRINPNTFVWKEGFDGWKLIRDVAELEFLFKDKNEVTPPEESADLNLLSTNKGEQEGEIILDYGQEPPYLFWLLLSLLIFIYVILQLFWK